MRPSINWVRIAFPGRNCGITGRIRPVNWYYRSNSTGNTAKSPWRSMASSRADYDSLHAKSFGIHAKSFDHEAASNKANVTALANLKKQSKSAFDLSLAIIQAPYSVRLQPNLDPLYLDEYVGVRPCQCEPRNAKIFANYMLDGGNRDASGFLRVPGLSAGSQGGYFGYDRLTGPVNSQVQSIRTLSAESRKAAQSLVRSIPGLLPLLQDVLLQLGSDPMAWEKHLAAFHGLILSADRQVEFAWHEDTSETPWLTRRCLTAVVQCSDAVTAMRMYGFQPFVYQGEGHTSVFPGHAIHQAYPLTQDTLDALPKPVVKAVFFLEPTRGTPLVASSSRGAMDRDHLVPQVHEALSRAQSTAKRSKRSKLT